MCPAPCMEIADPIFHGSCVETKKSMQARASNDKQVGWHYGSSGISVLEILSKVYVWE